MPSRVEDAEPVLLVPRFKTEAWDVGQGDLDEASGYN